jgi:NADPH2:quinone reductase
MCLGTAMKAVGYRTAGPIDRPDALVDLTVDRPAAQGHDVLVQVEAVSVNPIDTKIRARRDPDGSHRILGYDAAGVVVETGPEADGFAVGDSVYYAGTLDRPGTNAEFHLVDARIVGHAPGTLSAPEAAALPLTAITAWEMLFDRLDVRRPTAQGGGSILIIGGAGGVGSIAIQLLRALTDLNVIATASRPETKLWARELGAHHVLDHRRPLASQVAGLGFGPPGFVFSTTHTADHYDDIVELLAPQGRFGLIDDAPGLDPMALKAKAASLHWESMFARPSYRTPDLAEQGRLLDEVAALVVAGRVRSTLTEVAGAITAADLRAVHARIESGTTRGKIVLAGF